MLCYEAFSVLSRNEKVESRGRDNGLHPRPYVKRIIDSLQFFILVFLTVDDFMFVLESETKHLNKRRDDNGLEDKLTFQAGVVLGYARTSYRRKLSNACAGADLKTKLQRLSRSNGLSLQMCE